MKKITIIAVNWHANKFAKLLVDTACSKCRNIDDIEIIIVDNSGELSDKGGGVIPTDFNCLVNAKIIKPDRNLGHGVGIELGIEKATGKYILALDIDSHILLQDWDEKLIAAYEQNEGQTPDQFMKNNLRIIGAEGGLLKPIRPLFMFFEKEFFIQGKMRFQAVNLECVKFDVGIHFYFNTLSRGYAVKFLKYKKTDYKDVWGEEYTLNGEPMVFHHWYGTRWFNVEGKQVHNEIDGRKYEDFVRSRDNLFKQI